MLQNDNRVNIEVIIKYEQEALRNIKNLEKNQK